MCLVWIAIDIKLFVMLSGSGIWLNKHYWHPLFVEWMAVLCGPASPFGQTVLFNVIVNCHIWFNGGVLLIVKLWLKHEWAYLPFFPCPPVIEASLFLHALIYFRGSIQVSTGDHQPVLTAHRLMSAVPVLNSKRWKVFFQMDCHCWRDKQPQPWPFPKCNVFGSYFSFPISSPVVFRSKPFFLMLLTVRATLDTNPLLRPPCRLAGSTTRFDPAASWRLRGLAVEHSHLSSSFPPLRPAQRLQVEPWSSLRSWTALRCSMPAFSDWIEGWASISSLSVLMKLRC